MAIVKKIILLGSYLELEAVLQDFRKIVLFNQV